MIDLNKGKGNVTVVFSKWTGLLCALMRPSCPRPFSSDAHLMNLQPSGSCRGGAVFMWARGPVFMFLPLLEGYTCAAREVKATAPCRFKTHPYVTGLPHLRFYAGSPLISSKGHRIGSL